MGDRVSGADGTHRTVNVAAWLLLCSAGVARLDAQVSTADSAWAAGDFHGARIGYERALAGDSTSVRALYRLGVLASWDGELDSSLTLFNKARSYEPGDPDVRIAEARVLSWKGDYKGSVQHYDSVLADHPDNREAGLGRAQVLAWAGKYREADQQYALLMSVDPQDLDALAGRGQLAAWNADFPLAVEYYTAALAVDSNHVRSLVGLAQVRSWQGRHHEAMRLSDRALATESDNRDARQVQILARSARRPTLEPTVGWSHDTDDNNNWWETVAVSMYVADGLQGFSSVGLAQLSDPTRDANRSSAEGGARYNVGNFGFTGAIGVRNLSPDFADERTPATWRGSMSYRITPGAGVGVGYAHYPFDETAFLAGQDVDIDEVTADGDVNVGENLTLGGGGSLGWFSDGNMRHSFVVALTKRFPPQWTAGVYGRLLGYDQAGVGYFSPDRFLTGEGRGSYTYTWPGWEARAAAGLGIQQTFKGADVQAEWHLDGRMARKWGLSNEVALLLGWTNSAASSTTGAFRYFTGSLSARIGL